MDVDPVQKLDAGDDPELMDNDDKSSDELDVCGDGGLIKKVLVKGEGWKTPSEHSEVEVHYVGTLLDGTKFDSSRDRNEPFKFKLGEGQVIKGWDKGVAEMKQGEKALLTCRSDYAYGKSGSPPKIPPDATLNFEVELLGWCDEKDVSPDKDQSILVKTLKEGEGYETPSEETKVQIKYTARLNNSEGAVVLESGDEPFEFTIGEEEAIFGLDKACESLKKGEVAEITISSKHAYADKGLPEKSISPNANLWYHVEMMDFQKPKASWSMTVDEQLEAVVAKRNEGNALFKAGKLERAIKKYKKGIDFVEHDYKMSDEQKKEAKMARVPCHLNIAACAVKSRDWKLVVEQCDKALEIDTQSVKGLLRRGKAYSETDEWDLAERDFRAALGIDSKDKDARRELAALKKKVATQNAKDRKNFAGMFEKLEKMEAQDAARNKQEEEILAKLRASEEEAENKRKAPDEKMDSEPTEKKDSAGSAETSPGDAKMQE